MKTMAENSTYGDRRLTKEEIKKKTSICFLLNPNVSQAEKNYVIEKVMATKATSVSKAALCNIIIYIMTQNAELQKKLNMAKKTYNAKVYEN